MITEIRHYLDNLGYIEVDTPVLHTLEIGACAMGNRSLAIGVVGGMFVGTIALLFVVPVFFMFFQKLHERFQDGNTEIQLETEKSE